VPDAPLRPLPPAGRPAWLTALDDACARWGLGGRRAHALVASGVGVVVLIVVGVGLVVAHGGAAARSTPSAGVAPAAAEPSTTGPTSPTTSSKLVVDVAGAVVRPGLFTLPAGSRVADAIAMAGGPLPDADLRQVNQARTLADGEQVLVPRRGEVLPSPPSTAAGRTPKPVGPIDLNKATVADLDALPGVGPATAAAIVEWRNHHGAFRSVEDLLEVPGIGPAKLERLRPLVRV
jgi:competence protein ComEA